MLMTGCHRDCRLTNHGLEAAPLDLSFSASDEAGAGQVLQRLRAEEAADGSAATLAAGQSIPCAETDHVPPIFCHLANDVPT